jgi:arginase family enzyme
MRVVKACASADNTVELLCKNNQGGYFEISADEKNTEDSIVLREENRYPAGYGLIVISSKIDTAVLNRDDVVLFAISDYSKRDTEALDKNRVRYFTMDKISDIGLGEAADLAMENSIRFGKLCLSINLDCLDKAFYSNGVVGGITSRELIYCLRRFKLMKNLKTAEIAGDNAEIAAKLIRELT